MKKLFITLSAVIMALSLNATDIWTGSKYVTWGQGLQIEAAQFVGAQPGNLLKVHFTDATDGLEFKVMNANFDHLAGSREAAGINGNGSFEQFLTQAAVDSLKLYGLEIIGANFTCTKVELNDGKTLKEGITVWTGFFWADSWSTLELYYNGYAGVDFNSVSAIRFYSEAASGEYVLNFMEAWGEAGKIADQTAMTNGEGYKELALTDELRTRVANAGHWMIQFNKEGLAPFNVTDIVLVPNDDPTGIDNTNADAKTTKILRNGQLLIEQNNIRYNILGMRVK